MMYGILMRDQGKKKKKKFHDNRHIDILYINY